MKKCSHLGVIRPVEPRTPEGCEECLKLGMEWVHLRLCLTCGHVGCCDNSIGHPIIRSFEPGEDWAWCYVDQLVIEPAPLPA
jgi:hypothetical protein